MVNASFMLRYHHNGSELLLPIYSESEKEAKKVVKNIISLAKVAKKKGEDTFNSPGSDFPTLNTEPIASGNFEVLPLKDMVKDPINLDNLKKRANKKTEIRYSEKVTLDKPKEDDEKIEIFCIFDSNKNDFLRLEERVGVMFTTFEDATNFIQNFVDELDEKDKDEFSSKISNWRVYSFLESSSIELVKKHE